MKFRDKQQIFIKISFKINSLSNRSDTNNEDKTIVRWLSVSLRAVTIELDVQSSDARSGSTVLLLVT